MLELVVMVVMVASGKANCEANSKTNDKGNCKDKSKGNCKANSKANGNANARPNAKVNSEPLAKAKTRSRHIPNSSILFHLPLRNRSLYLGAFVIAFSTRQI